MACKTRTARLARAMRTVHDWCRRHRHLSEGQRLLDLRRLRVVARAMGVTSLIVRKGLFEVVFGRQMTQGEVKCLLAATTVPVEFSTTGDKGFRISRFKEGSAAEALRLLRAVEDASKEQAPAPTVH